MLRYLRRLADRDLALDRTMIPLGSCTMKLNATAEMEPITWPEWGRIHPFAPIDQAGGYLELIDDLEALARRDHRLRRGVAAAERGFAGRVRGPARDPQVPRVARRSRERDVCLIPASAHGTNAASAAMAGLRVVVVDVRRQRQRRPRRPEGEGDRARRPARGVDGHLPVDARRVRGADRRHLRGRARARRAGVPRRREPQRARRRGAARASSAPTCRTSICTRRSASRTAVAVPASGRSACARTSRRSCRTTRCSPTPARRAASRSAPRRGDRPASCRSRGRTSR